MEAIGKFVTGIVLAIFGTISRGFVIMKLWGWFMVTTFALPTLGLIQAMGVSLVVGLLTAEFSNIKTDEEWADVIGRSIMLIFVYAIVLLEGWIYLQFM